MGSQGRVKIYHQGASIGWDAECEGKRRTEDRQFLVWGQVPGRPLAWCSKGGQNGECAQLLAGKDAKMLEDPPLKDHVPSVT